VATLDSDVGVLFDLLATAHLTVLNVWLCPFIPATNNKKFQAGYAKVTVVHNLAFQ
jgi:hypothetical protein